MEYVGVACYTEGRLNPKTKRALGELQTQLFNLSFFLGTLHGLMSEEDS